MPTPGVLVNSWRPIRVRCIENFSYLLIFQEFNIETVYHAASYKHVNILENEIRAAMMNNIIGTYNLLTKCHSNSIKKFVMISTDKAATPTTVMGKTKKFCELKTEKNNERNIGHPLFDKFQFTGN